MIERFAMWLYRRLVPASLRRKFPQDFKDGLLVSLSLISRRDLATIRLRRTARIASKTGDWSRAVTLWQELAAECSPTNVQVHDGTLARVLARQRALPRARPGAEDLETLSDTELNRVLKGGLASFDLQNQRRAKYTRMELMRARLSQAMVLHDQGKLRHFREQVSRAVEAIPDQRVFKKDPLVLGALRLYVGEALTSDGLLPRPAVARDRPLRIAFCLDVLKLSDVHTHTRVIFAICRNLMQLDPAIETHVIVTNERFVVTTPIINASFDPGRGAALIDEAREALPEFFGTRFKLHVFLSLGLAGLVDTCQEILAIDPDLLLYGGGSKGFYSNESLVVRHCLFDHFPTAFFFIQSNNEVDPKNDLIIARGPHPVLGDPGLTPVRIQPYPTITESRIETVLEPERRLNKVIVSAIAGSRMDLRMAEQSDSDMRAFFSILDRNPGAVWHFIGAADPDGMIRANRHVARRVKSGQVVVHPVLPLPEFSALTGTAALFLHLPSFTGGSGGATVARRAGVPILTFRHSDVSGRQPAETVFETGDTAGFVAMANRLLEDGELWLGVVKRQFAHTRWIQEHSVQGFYDCLHEAHRAGLTRLAAAAGAAPAASLPRSG